MADQRREPNQRPSPEALLAKASKEESRAGRLKIFLGAAPGVGKTYEMLTEARGRLKDGTDVVVGVVETHGRKETEALTEGLETIPRKRVDYKDRELDEMDIDAILARRPKLVLVDELAHTNAAGSRHPKRYLDVEEILNNGIDVYTTLNIQHIESLNDVVAQITHVRVRETVPELDPRPRRRHRACRHHARGPDPAAKGRQGLHSQASRACARALFLTRQPDGAPRARAPAHGRARRRAAAQRDAGAGDPGSLGGRRAPSRLHQRGPARCRACALHEASRRSSPCLLDRALCRDQAQLAALRGGARSHRRHASPRTSARRGAGDHSERRPPHRRRRRRLRASKQHHADRHRQVDAVTDVRAAAWLGRARPPASRAAISASTSSPARSWTMDVIPKKTVRTAEGAAPFDPRPYIDRSARGRVSRLASASSFGRRSASRISISSFSPRLLASPCVMGCGLRCSPASSRRSATIFFSCRRSTPSPSPIRRTSAAFLFFIVVAIIVSNVAARARSLAVAAMGRARTTESLYVFSRKLVRRGHPRRRAVGHGVPDCAHAEGPRRPVAAGERLDRGQGRLSARGRSRSGRSRRGEMGVGARSRGRSRRRYAARREAAVPADAHGPRRHRRRRHRQRQGRARFSLRTSVACSMRSSIRQRWQSNASTSSTISTKPSAGSKLTGFARRC